jgi:ABC-type multidrug transport system ATPase subunit
LEPSLRSTTPAVSARGVRRSYGDKLVLEDACLAVQPGESVALVGENGAGKSTFLKILAGVIPAQAGEVRVAGRPGYCPQEPGILNLLTADEHLVLFGSAMGLSRRASLARGREALAEFGFPLEDRSVARDLSGGTRQKLNLALALLGDPRVLLLDEPYQGFDHGTYVNFWDHVDRWKSEGRAVVVVTHMIAELGRVDRVVELAVHPSRDADRSRAPRPLQEGAVA